MEMTMNSDQRRNGKDVEMTPINNDQRRNGEKMGRKENIA
jgi:hypothetical protein